MATLLADPIAELEWKKAIDFNGHALCAGVATGKRPLDDEEGSWRPAIGKIVAMQHLGDNWDGLGATAPSRELLASAVGLAYLLHQRGVEPPTSVVPSTAGTVVLEWQCLDGCCAEVEIVRPLFAEVMYVRPGQPAEHWVLPND